jgi:hypothetical protein
MVLIRLQLSVTFMMTRLSPSASESREIYVVSGALGVLLQRASSTVVSVELQARIINFRVTPGELYH